jgi:hypothetical protein
MGFNDDAPLVKDRTQKAAQARNCTSRLGLHSSFDPSGGDRFETGRHFTLHVVRAG